MAGTEAEDRTQGPSKQRLQQAREHGQVAHSPELTAAVGLLAATLLLIWWGDDLAAALIGLLREPLTGPPQPVRRPGRGGGSAAAPGLRGGVAAGGDRGRRRGRGGGGTPGPGGRPLGPRPARPRSHAALGLRPWPGPGRAGDAGRLGPGQGIAGRGRRRSVPQHLRARPAAARRPRAPRPGGGLSRGAAAVHPDPGGGHPGTRPARLPAPASPLHAALAHDARGAS